MPKKLPPSADQLSVPMELIERRIYLVRGRKVMLDADLAEIYQVLTKNLNLAVRRNANRFPPDFMFRLTEEEVGSLRLQIATSKTGRGGRRYLPYAFTEHGVAMLSSVLSSKRAVQMNIVIIRAFIKLREILASNRDLARRLDQVEDRLGQHGSAITVVIEEIKKLKQPPTTPKRRMGF
jgi:phage regulator Rha-like protein